MAVSSKGFLIVNCLLSLAVSLTAQVKSTPNPNQVAEKVYLHIDRSHYFSGDDIWFKAYVTDPATNLLSLNTNNLHVELISSEPELLLRRILRIENGTGNGDFHLSDSLASGKYLIRAYTNHMRNYGSDHFFRKEITVINPYYEDPVTEREASSGGNNFDIGFFPEGGSLVENVISKVAFKAVDESGRGCSAGGTVFSNDGDSITSFSARNHGMGYFMIRPKPGEKYYAIARECQGAEKKVFLPDIFATGLTMSASFTSTDMLLVTLRTNGKTNASLFGKDLHIILSSRNLVVKSTRIRISSPVSHYEVPFKGFPPGIIRLTLTDARGLPLSERLVFFNGPTDVRLNISTGNEEYKAREKVKVSLSLSCDSGSNESGEFSLSVAEGQCTDPGLSFPTTIASWFLLESDIRGYIEEPSSYFDQDNPDRKENLDLLLLTHGWRDFVWKYDSLPVYENEIGFDISGNVRRYPGNKPSGGTGVNMGIFGKDISDVIYAETDSLGNYKFENLDLVGDNKIVITSVNKRNKGTGTISIDPLNYNPAEIKGETFIYQMQPDKPAEYYYFRQEGSIKISESKKYKLTDTFAFGEVSVTAEKILTPQENPIRESWRFYGEPDNELVINPFSKSLIVRGFYEPRIFYAPKHDSPDKQIQTPDIRSTIFWEPSLTVVNERISTIEFYNADTPGTISIIAEGITESGIPVSRRIYYSIK